MAVEIHIDGENCRAYEECEKSPHDEGMHESSVHVAVKLKLVRADNFRCSKDSVREVVETRNRLVAPACIVSDSMIHAITENDG